MADFLERDRVLRAYLTGRTWDQNPEFQLARGLVLDGHAELAAFHLVFDYEWEVTPGHTNGGRGDLVFTDGAGSYAVVEVKFIDKGRSGSTARSKRTDSRKRVWEQASTYAWALNAVLGEAASNIRSFTLTNEDGLKERPVPGVSG